MKCPHCGMNIRDDITDCGYCGGKIVQESEKSTTGAGRPNIPGGSTVQKGVIKSGDEESVTEEEEEGGLSVILQKDEHVLIGSLNITVKKFFFHAYLTDRRIFLIDTQEKKVKVTAKDIPRESIVGSIIEFSENSDPVLVLSIRSPDDEIKTMKLVFVQNGMERSDEIDEWIALLHEEDKSKKSPVLQVEEIPGPDETPAPAEPERAAEQQELQPKRMPAKDHEKQPPVKRHLATHAAREQETHGPEPSRPQRRAQVREVPEQESGRGATPAKSAEVQTVRKREVQSAMKVAMKSAMQPLKHSSLQTSKRPVIEAVLPAKEPEPAEKKVSQKRPVVHEKHEETPVHDEHADIPQFCHNCGKKLPLAANFCPGCGTKLSLHRTIPHARAPEAPAAEKKPPHHQAPVREKKVPPKEEIDEEEKEDETPVPTKPPVKKLPKGSEMTILHKFLRR